MSPNNLKLALTKIWVLCFIFTKTLAKENIPSEVIFMKLMILWNPCESVPGKIYVYLQYNTNHIIYVE
jgi:hypothetical protein